MRSASGKVDDLLAAEGLDRDDRIAACVGMAAGYLILAGMPRIEAMVKVAEMVAACYDSHPLARMGPLDPPEHRG